MSCDSFPVGQGAKAGINSSSTTWSGHTTVLNSGVAIVSNKVNAHIDLVCVVLMLLVSIGTDSVVSVDRVGYETRHLECKTPGSEWIGLQ